MRQLPDDDVEAPCGGEMPSAGAREAVTRLFAEHNGALIRFLRLRLQSDQDAREVAQEAYVRLLQLDKPGAVSFLRAYLFRIAANLAADRQRRAHVRSIAHVDPLFEVDSDERDPERTTLAREQLAIIEAALRELPEKVRTAFLLHRMDGLSLAQVGSRMAVSERTAYNYVIKAMVHCRLRLDGET